MLEWFKRMYSKLPWATDWSHIEKLRQLVDSRLLDDESDQMATTQQPPPQEDDADVRPFELASWESAARSRQSDTALASRRKQVDNVHVQGVRQALDVFQGRIAFQPLEETDIGAMKLREIAQLFLRDAL